MKTTSVRHHMRRTPSGGVTGVVRHDRSLGDHATKTTTTIERPAHGIVIVNPNPKKGQVFAKKMIGENLMLRAYYFGDDDYEVYAYRRDNNKGKDSWVESKATTYPQKKGDVLINLREYEKPSDVTLVHPVLRDSGMSMSGGYDYKL